MERGHNFGARNRCGSIPVESLAPAAPEVLRGGTKPQHLFNVSLAIVLPGQLRPSPGTLSSALLHRSPAPRSLVRVPPPDDARPGGVLYLPRIIVDRDPRPPAPDCCLSESDGLVGSVQSGRCRPELTKASCLRRDRFTAHSRPARSSTGRCSVRSSASHCWRSLALSGCQNSPHASGRSPARRQSRPLSALPHAQARMRGTGSPPSRWPSNVSQRSQPWSLIHRARDSRPTWARLARVWDGRAPDSLRR